MTAATVRVLPRFPASARGINALSASISGGVLTIGIDPSNLAESADPTAPGNFTFILNTTTGEFELAEVASTVVDIATQAEAEAGSDNQAILSTLRGTQQNKVKSQLGDFGPSGTGAVTRTIQEKLRDFVTPGDNGTIQQAVTARRNVEGRAGSSYSFTGLNLGNSETFDGNDCLVTATAGTRVFALTGFAPAVRKLYISDNALSTEAAIVVGAGRYAKVENIDCPNTGVCGVKFSAGAGAVSLPRLNDVHFEGVTGTGVDIGSSVNEIRSINAYVGGILDTTLGKQRPRAGTVGWRQNTPVVSGNAVGGHQIVSANMITVDTGWHLTDAQLSRYIGCFGDSTRGYALIIDGASDSITFTDFFAGATMGIKVGGTSVNILLDGLETKAIGVVPPWGTPTFYNTVGPYYAITVEDTAKLTINGDAWTGDKSVSVASGATLTVTGGHWFKGKNAANIAAGATAYLGPDKEYASVSDALFRAPHDGYLFHALVSADTPPGAAQTITATVQIGGVDTTMVAVISGAATTFAEVYGTVSILKGQSVSLKVVKSAGATAFGRINFDVQMLRL